MKHFLTKELTTVGRSSHNDIVLPDPNISRTHIAIQKQGERWLVTDKSTNGTLVNNERISTRELKENDVIQIGDWNIHFGGEKEPKKEETTQVAERDPTRILSYQPHDGQLILERALLEVLAPERKLITIAKSIFTIGKAKSNDLVLPDDYVSNYHMKIENRSGVFVLKDLNSTNGTLLNGQRVAEAPLKPDSTIEIGKVKIRFFSTEEKHALEPSTETEFEGIQSQNPRMRRIFTLIERIAPSDQTILVQGETGTGKELVAAALHRRSPRARKPFLAINCGAISKDLIESELFGHEKGAFTSAHQQRKGVFELAHEGTLFLDEVGELPVDLQPKLLRVLETHEIRRVGGTQPIRVNVRIVAATHRDLVKEVKKGSFREDLFFRLYVVPITLPPLRERQEDIRTLAEHFLKQELLAGKAGAPKSLDSAAVDRLLDYHWPGNVREIKNVISRAVLNCRTETIGSGDIQFAPLGAADTTSHEFDEKTQDMPQTVARSLKDIERERIVTELKRNHWNKKETARVLGIAKSTLHDKIKKYGILENES